MEMSDWTNTLFEADLKEKVQNKLLFDAHTIIAKQKKEKSKASEEAAKEKSIWKNIRRGYRTTKNSTIVNLSEYMSKGWTNQNTTIGKLRDAGASGDDIEAAKKAAEEETTMGVAGILEDFRNVAVEYAKYVKKYENRELDIDGEVQYVKTQAESKFAKTKSTAMKLAKKELTVKSVSLNAKFNADKINMELANIPLKIEDTIDSIKETFDTILGHALTPLTNPELPTFELDALLGKIKGFVDPALAAFEPLTAVVPKIPILGDLATIFSMMSSNSSPSTASKEEIKKFIKEQMAGLKPAIDQTITDKIKGIIDDVTMVMMQIPMLMVNLIFAMINVIYSKLKIITSIIPLGGFFPLTLIDSAIEAGPKLIEMIKNVGPMLTNSFVGMIKDKLAEMAMLSFPKPDIDEDTLASMIPEIKAEQATPVADAPKIQSYSDITDEFYSTLSGYGYTKTQLNGILKNYKEIYNGTESSIKRYIDNGKSQKLGAHEDSLGSYFTGGTARINESEMENGFYPPTDVVRIKPSLDHYKKTLEEYLKSGEQLNVHLMDGLFYDKLYSTDAVVGGLYDTHAEVLSEMGVGDQIILRELIKPSTLRRKFIKRRAEDIENNKEQAEEATNQ